MPESIAASASRAALRRELRARRRAIDAAERAHAARRFALIADRAHLLRAGRRIALYLPYGHEADASALISLAHRRHCRVFLPVITHERRFRMQFVRVFAHSRLRLNSFGIAEPAYRGVARMPPQHLDAIFMPLVGFDSRGWRLGSGAGFYDRSLQFLRSRSRWHRPKLIGIAYEVQRVDELIPNEWDVPMNAVITEKHLYRCKNSHTRIER